MVLWKYDCDFFFCLSLKFFLFLLVPDQVKSNLHSSFCVYIKNTFTTCSCSRTCDALHLDCSSETRKTCLISLTYCQRGHHYADSGLCLGHTQKGCSVSYGAWKYFSTHSHTEDGQWRAFYRVTEVKSQQGEYTASTENIRKKTAGDGKGRETGCQLPLLCLHSLNVVHYNLDFAFILIIQYALWSDPITVTLLESASTADVSLCYIIEGYILIVVFQRDCSRWFK